MSDPLEQGSVEAPASDVMLAAAPAGASTDESPRLSSDVDMNDVMRAAAGLVPMSTPDDDEDDGDADPALASAGDVRDPAQTAQPPAPGRRSRRAQADAARIADLERQLADRTPEQLRAQVLAEQQQAAERAALESQAEADAERYRELLSRPDADLSPQEYAWREDRKELLARYPQVREFADGVIAADRKALAQQVTARETAFWEGVRRQLASVSRLPSVDAEAIKTLPDWDQIGSALHAAGATSRQPEVDSLQQEVERLRAEVEDLRRVGPRGLVVPVTPPPGGRSAGPGSTVDMNEIMRRAAGLI